MYSIWKAITIHIPGVDPQGWRDGDQETNWRKYRQYFTLTLPNISVEDMGTYVCTVDVSITSQNGQIKQTGHNDIFVHGTPFIENKKSMFIGMINVSARIEIPFYSNPSLPMIKFYMGATTVEVTNTSDTLIFLSSSLNTFTFYGKEVLLNGQSAVLQFKMVKTTDYGEYTAVLLNDIGSTYRSIVFSSESASSLDIGTSIGIGFGGFFLGVVGTIFVIIIIWKRITATPKYSSMSEPDMSTDMQKYANTGVSSLPAPSHYEELQQDRMEKPMYDCI